MYSNFVVLAIALIVVVSAGATPVTVRIELDTTPSTGLPKCSDTFLSGFLAQLTSWVEKQSQNAAPDLTVGAFTLTYHSKARRLEERKASTSACDTASTPGSIVACASAACTNCGTTEFPFVIGEAPFYSYLSQTVQSLGRNYVIDPAIPDNGCLGLIPNLSVSVTLIPNVAFDGSAYPTLPTILASW